MSDSTKPYYTGTDQNGSDEFTTDIIRRLMANGQLLSDHLYPSNEEMEEPQARFGSSQPSRKEVKAAKTTLAKLRADAASYSATLTEMMELGEKGKVSTALWLVDEHKTLKERLSSLEHDRASPWLPLGALNIDIPLVPESITKLSRKNNLENFSQEDSKEGLGNLSGLRGSFSKTTLL